MLSNLNLFEVLSILSKNHNLKAVKDSGCEIKWIERVLDNPPRDPIKQLVFINLYGHENPNILTDIMIEQQNQPIWSITEA